MGRVQHGDGEGDRLTTVELATIQPGTAVAFALFLLVGVAIPAILVLRDIRQERRRLTAPLTAAATADFSSYLSTLSDRLGFVPEQSEQICAEIEAHLYDTSDALIEGGMERAAAKRQAMDQLGSPADLAGALREARRDRAPVLATVGGGAIEAGKGLVRGFLLGTILVFGAATLVVVVFGLLEAAGTIGSDDGVMGVMRRAMLLPAMGMGLAVGSQRGTLAVARATHRTVSRVARAWAMLGAAVVAWLAIFVVEDDMAWLEAVTRLVLPLAVAIGALRAGRPLRRPSLSRVALSGAGLVVLLVILALVAGPPQARHGQTPANLDVLPALGPEGTVPTDGVRTGLYADCDERDGQVECEFLRGDREPELASSWRDLRLEAWPATLDGTWPASGVDPSAHGPTIVVPVDADDRFLAATLDIGERRDGPGWWFVLTGLHTDGQRYRLSDGEGEVVPFVGTVADWLNAPW